MVPTISKRISTNTEVIDFLNSMRAFLQDKHALYIVEKFGKNDKKAAFKSKYNINHDMVVEELMNLDCSNYCCTDIDDNPAFKGEVWIFG